MSRWIPQWRWLQNWSPWHLRERILGHENHIKLQEIGLRREREQHAATRETLRRVLNVEPGTKPWMDARNAADFAAGKTGLVSAVKQKPCRPWLATVDQDPFEVAGRDFPIIGPVVGRKEESQ